MSKSEKPEIHIHCGSKLKDEKAAKQSCIIDAADDKRWFDENPSENVRKRLASKRERAAEGLPLGSFAVIFRGLDGCQVRTFTTPDADLN